MFDGRVHDGSELAELTRQRESGSLYLRTDNGPFYWKNAGGTWTLNT